MNSYLLNRATDAWTEPSPDEAKTAIENLEIPAAEKAVLTRRLRY